MTDKNVGECGTAQAWQPAAPCVVVGCSQPTGHHGRHDLDAVGVSAALTPPSPAAMAEPAVAALWAAVSLQAEQIRSLLALESFRRQRDEAREERNAAVALRVDALQERDAARAEADRLRLGRAELEQMRRAALAELEDARRLLGRMTPDPRETGLLEERREILSLARERQEGARRNPHFPWFGGERRPAARCANCRHRWNEHEAGGGRCAESPFGGCGCERFVDE